jgi:flagellar protein FlaF
MGFSVSGSAAIIFLAAFVGFGVLYTSAYNSFELIETAADDREAELLGQQNTEIQIVAAEAFAGNDTVTVTIENTGTTELGVNETDLLVNGTYQADPSTSVEGAADSSLWLPGENLTMETSYTVSGPTRIKVVTEHGIAAYHEVSP